MITPATIGAINTFSRGSNLVADYRLNNTWTDETGNHDLEPQVDAGFREDGFVAQGANVGDTGYDYLFITDGGEEWHFGDGLGNDMPFTLQFGVKFDLVGDSWFCNKRTSGTSGTFEYQIVYYLGKLQVVLFSEGLAGVSTNFLRPTYVWTPVADIKYNIAIVYDATGATNGISSIKVYVNGIELTNAVDESVGTYVAMANTGTPIWFGTIAWQTGNTSLSLNGMMDCIKLWKEVRTDEQIKEVAEREINGQEWDDDSPIVYPVPFKIKVDTTIVDTTPAGQMKITISGGTSYYDIKTSDGQEIYGVSGSYTITFPSPNIYEIELYGQFGDLAFYNNDDAKLIELMSWGDGNQPTSMASFMRNCTSASITATDIPDLSLNTSFAWCFYGNLNLVDIPNIKDWNVSNISNFGSTFFGCRSFNSPLTNWDTASATGMSYMFYDCQVFNQPLDHFKTGLVTSFSNMFRNAYAFNQPLNNWNVSNCRYYDAMFRGARVFNQPLSNWVFRNTGVVMTTTYMFAGAWVFNQNIGNFNMTDVTNMTSMFGGATAFNNGGSSDINNWNTLNVTVMNRVFELASAFNQPIGGWNTSKVTTMLEMFEDAIVFNNGGNPNIDNWDTGLVEMTVRMFDTASAFNQPIGSWNMSSNKDMEDMFKNASSFNQNLTNWNTISNTDYRGMFYNAIAFAGDVSNWTIGSGRMDNMFRNCPNFNSPMNNWNMSNITNIQIMFYQCTSFNQDLSSWDISNKTTLYYVFNLSGFNQDISSWNISGITRGETFMDNSAMSAANYDALLIGWEAQTVQPNVVIGFKAVKRTPASDVAKASLQAQGWIIVDGGYV